MILEIIAIPLLLLYLAYLGVCNEEEERERITKGIKSNRAI